MPESDLFVDLNLNQIINAVVSEKEDEYHLKTFLHMPLQFKDDILYRQEIMQDLEDSRLFRFIQLFAKGMHDMREQLPQEKKHYYKYQGERLFLDAAKLYCDIVRELADNLSLINLQSRGFLALREYVNGYIQSERFTVLCNEAEKLLNELSAVRYCVLVKGLHIEILPFRAEADYTKEVEQTFQKFSRGSTKDYHAQYSFSQDMNHVEAAMLEGVAQLYPELFKNLENFSVTHSNYADETITVFDREVQFYVSYLDYVSKLKESGLPFCYPLISENDKDIYTYNGFDLALAYQLKKERSPVICNDFYLKDDERIIIVSGPNQGGKTTFARTFGQLHYLAALGCPVPGREAKLFLFDNIFTHFEKEENILNLRSKLEDDLVRIHHILDHATSNSIIIMNEILSSTTLKDAIFLSEKIMERIAALDILCVWVTFIDELLSLNNKTVSMVSTVVPDNPAVRTFKIERMPADGLAYALSIAEKYHVTYKQLKERI